VLCQRPPVGCSSLRREPREVRGSKIMAGSTLPRDESIIEAAHDRSCARLLIRVRRNGTNEEQDLPRAIAARAIQSSEVG
jgi:hypothetical protein